MNKKELQERAYKSFKEFQVKMEAFISVIIPTYNSAQTISACLESIVGQSYSHFEVLIMDGLSSDETISIARSFKDARIRIYSEKDKGIYDAMNKGIQMARGEWLLFLGSDDSLYNKEVLGKVVNFIESSGKAKVIYGNVHITGNTGWSSANQVYDGPFDLKKILNKNLSHQSIFYSRSLFTDMGLYNLSYKVCSDYDFNLRCFAKHKFLYFDLIISNFEAGGISTKVSDEKFAKDFMVNVCTYFNFQLFKPTFSKFKHVYLSTAVGFIKQKNYKRGALLFMAAFWHRFLQRANFNNALHR